MRMRNWNWKARVELARTSLLTKVTPVAQNSAHSWPTFERRAAGRAARGVVSRA